MSVAARVAWVQGWTGSGAPNPTPGLSSSAGPASAKLWEWTNGFSIERCNTFIIF